MLLKVSFFFSFFFSPLKLLEQILHVSAFIGKMKKLDNFYIFLILWEQKSWKGSVLNSVSTLDEISHGCCHASNHSDIIFFSLCERSWRIEAEINTTLEINCIRSLLMFLANFIVDIGGKLYPHAKNCNKKKIFKIYNAYIVSSVTSKKKIIFLLSPLMRIIIRIVKDYL